MNVYGMGFEDFAQYGVDSAADGLVNREPTIYDWQPHGSEAGSWVAVGSSATGADQYLEAGLPSTGIVAKLKKLPTWALAVAGGGVAIVGASLLLKKRR
jgi:hypothetical protein